LGDDPEGTGPLSGRLLTWNAGHCVAYAMKHDVDDVGFIRALIEDVISEFFRHFQRQF
jgi:poly(3-hydroxybutyrate) depolymerase